MDCRVCQNLLNQYLDNELEGQVLADLERHIEGCPECMAELDRLRKMNEFLNDLRKVEVPEGEREAFIDALRDRIEAEGGKVEKRKSILRPVLVSAIVVVLVLITFVTYPKTDVDIRIAPASGLNALENMAIDRIIAGSLDDHFLATSGDFLADPAVSGGQALTVWKILKETHGDLFEPAE